MGADYAFCLTGIDFFPEFLIEVLKSRIHQFRFYAENYV